jgi:hypothetical protein
MRIMGRGMVGLGWGNDQATIGAGSFAYWFICGLRLCGICCCLCVGTIFLCGMADCASEATPSLCMSVMICGARLRWWHHLCGGDDSGLGACFRKNLCGLGLFPSEVCINKAA